MRLPNIGQPSGAGAHGGTFRAAKDESSSRSTAAGMAGQTVCYRAIRVLRFITRP
jgi:hypothetical protein